MTASNMCPDCKKTYSKMPSRCICGWYLTNETVSTKTNSIACQFVKADGSQCAEVGSVSFRIRGSEWFCGEHVRKLREESYTR